jgi:hypothetical protein
VGHNDLASRVGDDAPPPGSQLRIWVAWLPVLPLALRWLVMTKTQLLEAASTRGYRAPDNLNDIEKYAALLAPCARNLFRLLAPVVRGHCESW